MKFTKEIKIALVSIFGIVVLFFGLQFLKGLSVFSSDNAMYVAFSDAIIEPLSTLYDRLRDAKTIKLRAEVLYELLESLNVYETLSGWSKPTAIVWV